MRFLSSSSCWWLLQKDLFEKKPYLLDPRLWPEGSYELGSVHRSFHPSVLRSFRLSGSFLGIGSLVFFETQHRVRGPCDVVHDRAGFFEEKKICHGENGPKIGFFEFIGKIFLNLVYKESLYYLLYSCTNPILRGKIWFFEIWAKMLSANHIAGFSNRLYL